MDDDQEFVMHKPDGTTPTIREVIEALHQVTKAGPGDMACDESDCDGRIEGKAPFWMRLHDDGTVSLDGIGWFEAGEVHCSSGNHVVDEQVQVKVRGMLYAFCAQAETRLGAIEGEDQIAKRDTPE